MFFGATSCSSSKAGKKLQNINFFFIVFITIQLNKRIHNYWHSRMRSEVESAQKLARSIEDTWYQSFMTTILRIYFEKSSFHLKIYNFIQQRWTTSYEMFHTNRWVGRIYYCTRSERFAKHGRILYLDDSSIIRDTFKDPAFLSWNELGRYNQT